MAPISLADSLTEKLAAIVGPENVARTATDRLVYEVDAFTMAKQPPAAVVHPGSTEEVQEIVRLANREGIPFVARGAGTGLSGGALVHAGGIVISLTRMRRILDIDIRNRRATAEAGVVNLRLTQQVVGRHFHYAPDPSSQMACTLGGNVAENAGGPHTLKYGVTTNHLLGLKMVLGNGEILDIPGDTDEPAGYDLLGIIAGSEGTFGIVTEVTVRLTRLPEAAQTALVVFSSVADATRCVSDIIAAGVVPAALELMDATIIKSVEGAFHFGFPLDAGAVLIIEIDGVAAGLDKVGLDVEAICKRNNAREVRVARDENERERLWMCRKKAVGTLGRIAPSHCTMDGVIPRSKLPDVLELIADVAERHNLLIANLFHAGDGSLHPLILFDERNPEEVERVQKAGGEVLKACVEVGGTITGEHGVGVEKLEYMRFVFSENDIDTMARIRDVFNPARLCNPDKVVPPAAGLLEQAEGVN